MKAKDAKILATNSKKGNITQLLVRIRNAASMGILKIYNVEMHFAQKVALESLGYIVELSPDVMEDYEISWAD